MELTIRILKERMGTDFETINRFVAGQPDDKVIQPGELLNRDDYIATKLWERQDIANTLNERGYLGTDAEVDSVLNTGMLEALNDCTDTDWEIINQACSEAGFEGRMVD